MLTLEYLSCKRAQHPLFTALSLTLGQGALLFLRGPNGSGKTSLLRMLAGFLPMPQGEIYWEGEHVDPMKDLRWKQAISYVGHRPGLYMDRTVSDHFALWAKLEDAKEKVPAAQHFWGLGDMLHRPVHQLSQGYQKRLALARLMLENTEIWLLDEPFAHLDEVGCAMLLRLLAVRCDQHGIVLASHHGPLPAPIGLPLDIADFQPHPSTHATP